MISVHPNLLNLLTGTTDGFTLYPEYNTYTQSWYEDELVKDVRKELGTSDEYWALVVAKIIMSDHYLDLTTTLRDSMPEIDNWQLFERNTKMLVGDADGTAAVLPVDYPLDLWPSKSTINIQYTQGDKFLKIYFNYKCWVVHCHYHKDRLYVRWPKELGLHGALHVPNRSTFIPLQLNLRYPVALVAQKLTQNNSFYLLAEQVERTHDFFYSDTDYERIGIAALALAQYIDKNNTL